MTPMTVTIANLIAETVAEIPERLYKTPMDNMRITNHARLRIVNELVYKLGDLCSPSVLEWARDLTRDECVELIAASNRYLSSKVEGTMAEELRKAGFKIEEDSVTGLLP